MSTPGAHRRGLRTSLTSACAALAVGVAGCGHATAGGGQPARVATAPLTSAFATSAGTWALVEIGGSAAQHNNFWELFRQPSGSTTWQLATPTGVADNGGLVIAASGGSALLAGFRPSQLLSFTPLAMSSDGGRRWASSAPLDAALASTPDALAASPVSGQVMALLTNGQARLSTAGTARWTTTASLRSLGDSPAGRRCGLRSLTAAAFSPSGVALLGGACAHGAGVFALGGGAWHSSAPHLPGPSARGGATVLRLTRSGEVVTALLAVGSGAGSSLVAAWSADSGGHWTLSPPLRLGAAALTSTAFGTTGGVTVVLGGRRASTVAGAGAAWHRLPTVPPGTAAVTAAANGGYEALAAHRTTLSVWRLQPGRTMWDRAQSLTVPLQLGSSS